MKINIKSNKGVTITGLVIYVSSFFMICVLIAVITTFFNNNTRFLSSEATASAEYDVLNAYLAKDSKTKDNAIAGEPGGSYIEFTNGNKYIFEKSSEEAEYGKIYLCNTITNKYFIVANYVGDVEFSSIPNKNAFEMKIKILKNEYTQTYNLVD